MHLGFKLFNMILFYLHINVAFHYVFTFKIFSFDYSIMYIIWFAFKLQASFIMLQLFLMKMKRRKKLIRIVICR